MELIYHSCMAKNVDRLNKLIGPREKCTNPTAQCFSKYPQDASSRAKTQRTYSAMGFCNREVYYERIRPVLYCLIFTVLLLYIVNNRKILTNNRNERRHFERKYNEL